VILATQVVVEQRRVFQTLVLGASFQAIDVESVGRKDADAAEKARPKTFGARGHRQSDDRGVGGNEDARF
jgi:hypothetical protein